MDVESDEEVVLPSSALHKYMAESQMTSLTKDVTHEIKPDNACLQSAEVPSASGSRQVIKLSGQTANLVQKILETGLLYPDHLSDLSEFIEISRIKEIKGSSLNFVSCCSVLLTSSGSILLCPLQWKKPIVQFSLYLTSAYCVYNAYRFIKSHSQDRILKHFAKSINTMFSVTKKIYSFVIESEIILKSKLNKQEPFYLSKKGWMNQNLPDTLISSNLAFSELRSILCETLQYLVGIFKSLCEYSRSIIELLPVVACDLYYKDLLASVSDECNQKLNPGIDEIKRFYNMYLVMQSECLKRLVFSFVKQLSTNYSYSKADGLISEIGKSSKVIVTLSQNLEAVYKKQVSNLQSRSIDTNKQLRASNVNDKLYIYLKNIVMKTDVQCLSLLFDLRMIDDWINESEESSKVYEAEECTQFLKTFYERLITVKINVETLNSMFNEHCITLKSMIEGQSTDTTINEANGSHIEAQPITKTGIELGKSNFEVCGEDEVFVSLSSLMDNNEIVLSGDYKEMAQKCLPKNVLLELKSAIKVKKEEMLEREKKALTSDIPLEEFDKLFNSADEVSTITRGSKTYSLREESSSDSDRSSISSVIENTTPRSYKAMCNVSQSISTSSDSSKDSVTELNIQSSSNPFATHQKFIDQIKSTQISFNLPLREEEFIDSGSETE